MDPRSVSTDEFRHYLESLADEHAHPDHGFFGPGSISWRVSGELAVYLGGVRAILMQVANPKVAQGVADHSDFRREPFARLWRTFEAVHAIVFGTRNEAIAAALRVHTVHRRVHGTLNGSTYSSDEYHANDPALLLWVYATLVDSSIMAYTTFVGPQNHRLWRDYYAESKLFAALFGIPNELLPAGLDEFDTWMQGELSSRRTEVSDTALDIAAAILSGPILMRVFKPATYVLAAGTLPPSLREQFRIPWTPFVRRAYRLGARSVRGALPYTPRHLRTVPAARSAQRRCLQ